ncbi:MAG: DUF1573 domain-containing protein [Gemmataceae bacterium]|nr:DUF1573 domain-containing protein [Gemmataceae bacterium]
MNTLLLLAAVGVADPPAPAPAPLHCPAPAAARGEVKAGPPLAHTFELTHRGPAGTLTITKVEAGCGCLRRALATGVLQPGETTRLTVEVNTLTQPDGPNRWQAVVSYALDVPGDPAARRTGELPLTITATLSRDVSIDHPQVAFSTTGAAAQVLTLTDRRAAPLRVVQAAGTSPHLTAEVKPRADAPGKPSTQEVVVKLAADAPPGHRDEAVILLTDDPAYPELRVPVRVLKRAPGGVTASPDEVVVRAGAVPEDVATLVQLRAADGRSVGVAGAESDHPGVLVKWSAGVRPVAAVRVTVTAAAAAKPGGGTVRVKLAEPPGAEVVIPVSWTTGDR